MYGILTGNPGIPNWRDESEECDYGATTNGDRCSCEGDASIVTQFWVIPIQIIVNQNLTEFIIKF